METKVSSFEVDNTISIQNIKERFNNFILQQDHPCIMAQTVFKMGAVDLHAYDEFATKSTARKLISDIKKYIDAYDFESNDFKTFLAVFPTIKIDSEIKFEQKLWELLQHIHDSDSEIWDDTVSSNPEEDTFSFSIAGKAFYIVGMHPNSSRKARQSPFITIAFNLHWQFEKLREMGSYEVVKERIRERDKAQQGSINPMLEDFGSTSEARQYSGRKTEDNWKCPFHNHSS
ncbi:YqcI/YcgG family protein [Marixanthomonas sp. SCSIO 43207]|uniref:guanitoxin biosynthesis heme-dependent pre-guanitoxin N-hydroxylase GntA n=1 Tax=Marixanthomonas sp. SCSIO 43207 TaxID=2779360 RepID=UPI001CA86111|nr:guanitoxin biosynthesis heme-dependent pre-guanitoxin N-hydroxylase GntA [Marixanthomonas sp. SCSIO 43207]UAB80034.1 YqcI/YcgG family protein [Marixanthomonas sp. SCSIO 43207]